MTVLLVLATFLAFVLVDWLLGRRAAQTIATVTTRPEPREAVPAYVEGFLLAEDRRYHPGHAWVLRERRNVARVGVDEFAAVLAGPVEKLELPKPGRWLRQGQKAWAFLRDGERTEMVSPIEGEVLEGNPEVVADPSLLRSDPYGRGWLITVSVPDEENTARNLIPAALVRGWLREAVERLYARQPALAGAVAADGGRPADNVFAALTNVNWKELTREFFLS
jgi:glycine cleavage system H lipoate-binding protein